MIKIAIATVVAYVFFAGMVYIGQRSMVYYPSAFVPADAELASHGLTFWPNEKDYRGFTTIGGTTGQRAIVIIFHGNAGLAHNRLDLALSLTAAGFRVVMAEYPGYGARPGKPTESVLIKDAAETVRMAADYFGLPVYLWGESLGSGVATGVIATLASSRSDVPIEGVVLQVPFDSMANVAQHHYWYLPARWFLKDKYNSVDYLRNYQGRVGILAAENDNVVPAKFAHALFSAIATEKKMWMVAGAAHYFPADHAAPWWNDVLSFIAADCDETERDC